MMIPNIPLFSPQPDCEACELYVQCSSPGIPTRAAGLPDIPLAPSNWPAMQGDRKALVFIGQNPGREEDQTGISWVGWTGKLLHRWIAEVYKFHDYADIYLANAVRCATPGNATPHASHLNKCRPFLHQDLHAIVARYGPNNVYLCCLGAPATRSITNRTIRSTLPFQGAKVVPHKSDLPALRTFYTYHPAKLSPGRDPAQVVAVDAHLKLLLAALKGAERKADTLPPIEKAPSSIGPTPLISLDIETYGILKNQKQTVFHPVRAREVDKVPPYKQVVCASVAWMDGPQTRVAWYDLYDPAHRRAFTLMLHNFSEQRLAGGGLPTILGHTITFDLLFLRAGLPQLCTILNADHFDLEDLAIINHLHADQRPEHSLKAISHLFNTANYLSLPVSTLPTGQQARSSCDPNLMFYNCTDTVSTLRLYQQMILDLHNRWPLYVFDFNPQKFRSDLIWTILHMAEAGLQFDMNALRRLHTSLLTTVNKTSETATALGYTLHGTGSPSSKQQLITTAFESIDMLEDPRVAITDVRKQVSANKDNVNLLLASLPLDNSLRPAIQLLSDHAKAKTIIDSYTSPLMTAPSKGCLPDGRAFPSWFPVPTFVKDETGKEGGTKQGRFAAHGPAAQTLPPTVKSTLCSRYPGGVLLTFDLSQMELRMAALLSGDPIMQAVYNDPTRDLHHEMAAIIYPDLDPAAPTYKARREIGKRANFLIIYRGGPNRLIETARSYAGLELSYDFAQYAIAAAWKDRQGLWDWQQRLIEDVTATGEILLPTGWKRTFTRSKFLNDETYINEICNCPVQTLAAQVLQSAQAEILRARNRLLLTFCMPSQSHDEIIIDCPALQAQAVGSLVGPLIKEPPLWQQLCLYHNRHIPLDFSVKQLYPQKQLEGA